MTTDLSVAHTILQQLGGNKFIVMTGAKNFVGSPDALSFHLPGKPGYVKGGINIVRIRLTPLDVYEMTFYRYRAPMPKPTVVETVDDVYNDMLQDVFRRVTGLNTKL